MKKWIPLVIWLFSCLIFFYGQFTVPPNYHLIPNDPWGNIFGICVIVGTASFLLFILFLFKDIFAVRNKKKKGLYNLSFKRIFSRVILTLIVGVFFGILMFPFLKQADGLLYSQRSAIGMENVYRMVFLWGIYTTIVSLFTLWRKKYRMVSIFLIICWILSLLFVALLISFSKNDFSCSRSSPYTIQPEFNRSLDLISQRMGIDNSAGGTVLQTAFDYRNCLNVQYAEPGKNELEGYYVVDNNSDLQNLEIFINPSYRNFDDLTLSSLLVHELVHVGQHISDKSGNKKLSCYEDEAQAFIAQSIYNTFLNDEERRSITTRIQDDAERNPIFEILLNTDERVSEAYNSCLSKELDKDSTLFNECVWSEAQTLIEQDVRENEYYKSQCEGMDGSIDISDQDFK